MSKDKTNGVVIHCHPKGWMDENGMKVWFDKVWLRRSYDLSNKKSLLVLDQCRAHITENTKMIDSASKTVLAMIHREPTSQL
jgi:DDE superfamily endonuclease